MIGGECLDLGSKGAYLADELGVFPKCGEELMLLQAAWRRGWEFEVVRAC